MKLVFSLLFTFILYADSKCQQGYRVTYSQDPFVLPVTFNGEKQTSSVIKDRLVIDDSLSMSFRLINGIDPANKKKGYGKKLVPHGVIFNSKSGIIYNMLVWGGKKGEQFMFWDTLQSETWMFLNESKDILGYSCKAAMTVTEKNDTTLVWYTEEIPRPFGPYYYVGFPGLVLEITDQRLHRHMVAKKIENDDFVVLMPTAKLYTSAEADKMHSEGRVPSKGTYYKTIRQKRN